LIDEPEVLLDHRRLDALERLRGRLGVRGLDQATANHARHSGSIARMEREELRAHPPARARPRARARARSRWQWVGWTRAFAHAHEDEHVHENVARGDQT